MTAVSMMFIFGACSKSGNKAEKSDDNDKIENTANALNDNSIYDTYKITAEGVQGDVLKLGNFLLNGAEEINAATSVEEGDAIMERFSQRAETELSDLDDDMVLTDADRQYLAQCYTAFLGTSMLRFAQLNGADINDPDVEAALDNQMNAFIDALSESLAKSNTLGEASMAIGNIL